MAPHVATLRQNKTRLHQVPVHVLRPMQLPAAHAYPHRRQAFFMRRVRGTVYPVRLEEHASTARTWNSHACNVIINAERDCEAHGKDPRVVRHVAVPIDQPHHGQEEGDGGGEGHGGDQDDLDRIKLSGRSCHYCLLHLNKLKMEHFKFASVTVPKAKLWKPCQGLSNASQQRPLAFTMYIEYGN